MAYKAFINGTLFFDTAAGIDELLLTEAIVEKVAGESGSFLFTLPPSNVVYDQINRLTDYVDVYKDDAIIFSGRVYSIREAFNTCLTVECEGMLAVLNDSVIRPFVFDDTVENLFRELVAQHNSQVGTDKQVTVRSVTISDRGQIAYRNYEAYQTTISRLNDLVGSFGGYLRMERTVSGLMLDWLEAYTDESAQTIDLGENVIDITQEETSDDLVTVLIPLGTQLEDESGLTLDARLTIESVNGGLDYIEADAEYLQRYGRIYGTRVWDDVTTPAILKSKGQAWLNSLLQPKLFITVSAVDLSDAGYAEESFSEGQVIKVTSEPHNINGVWFECTEQRLNLLNPGNNRLTLGSVETGYIKAKRQQDAAAIAGLINRNYQLNEAMKGIRQDLVQQISTFESTIQQLPDSISASVLETVQNQYGEIIATLEAETRLLSDSYNIWFSEDGRLNTWFEFTDDYFTIRKNGQSVYSRQDNDSYEFCDANGNTLLELNTDGMTAPTANVRGQLRFLQGNTGQWAIRKGAYISSLGGVNLDDVWIG